MALQTISVDDRSFDQLLGELKKHIPVSQWTDHNPSDPGIMLLELFAWLGEMTLYQMNRVPDTHKNKFLKLIIDPPEPVTVDVKLVLELTLSYKRTKHLRFPQGIRFATDFKNGKRYIFETFQETEIQVDIPAPAAEEDLVFTKKVDVMVKARNRNVIETEELGISDGSPNQYFKLKQAAGKHPLLLDFVNVSPNYDPNPKIIVDGDTGWELKPFLLTKESKTPIPDPGDSPIPFKHFMADQFENVIRFGDNTFGAIPPKNAVIQCTYQVLPGPEALIKAGELKHILDDIPVNMDLLPLESVTIKKINAHEIDNNDAQGGVYFVEEKEQFAKGLENFKKPYRLVTALDFELALMNDFNELQRLTRQNTFNELPIMIKDYDLKKLQELKDKNEINTLTQLYDQENIEEKINQLENQQGKKFTEEEKKELRFQFLMEKYFHIDNLPKSLFKICRATALMNRKLIKTSQLLERAGHVTILVIPEFNKAELVKENKDQIEVTKELEDKILCFLDKRRLITTHLHIMPVKLKKINIKIYVVIFKERSAYEMEETIGRQIYSFLDIFKGGFDQKGWPTGKDLYKSHLYRLVEGIDGVDYIKSLTFGPTSEENCLELGEHELPLIQSLDIYLERT